MVIYNKLLLIVGCIILMTVSFSKIGFMEVLGFLTSISCSCFLSYLNPQNQIYKTFSKQRIYYYLIAAFLILCLINPVFIVYLPLIFFDICATRNRYLCAISILIIGYQSFEIKIEFIVLLLTLNGFCLLLYFLTYRIQLLNDRLRIVQDTNTEDTRSLRRRNKDLMERQDYEIHVATLNERNRIAREIHDNVGHMLSRSILQMGALLAINKDPCLDLPLLSLKDTLSQAMDSIRSSVHDLYDDSIDLKALLESILEDFKNYEVKLDYDIANTTPRNIKYCFISIAKEALSNIVKHSNADSIRIILREHPSLYQLLIQDNGTDIVLKEDGIGLENMKERVNVFHGNFAIDTKSGFKLFISIPKENSHEHSCSR